jgi:hypothetical protein
MAEQDEECVWSKQCTNIIGLQTFWMFVKNSFISLKRIHVPLPPIYLISICKTNGHSQPNVLIFAEAKESALLSVL